MEADKSEDTHAAKDICLVETSNLYDKNIHYQNDSGIIYNGDSLQILKQLPDEIIQTIVTSPPYWNLRDYQTIGQIGLEQTIDGYIYKLVEIFKEAFRVLKKDGTLWLNLGDSYNWNQNSNHRDYQKWPKQARNNHLSHKKNCDPNLKAKDLCGIPWRVAFALQAQGWYLRQDIIWHKPNPMPESVKDRPTKAHEYLFLMSKSKRYYYDWEAIKEEASPDTHARYARGKSSNHKYLDGGPGNQTIAKSFDHMIRPGVNPKTRKIPSNWQTRSGSHDTIPKGRYKQNPSFSSAIKDIVEYRNKRSVWTIITQGTSDCHFATFPEKLVEPCILAGSKKGDIILDPFAGSCTVAVVAQKAQRQWIMIDINEDYCEMGKKRITREARQRVLF